MTSASGASGRACGRGLQRGRWSRHNSGANDKAHTDQIELIGMIVEHLTEQGSMAPPLRKPHHKPSNDYADLSQAEN